MAKWSNTAVTSYGKELLAEALAGTCTIEFVAVSIGSGSYSDDEKSVDFLEAQVDLKESRNEYGISSFDRNGNTVILKMMMDNASVNDGYYIRELGVWARRKGSEEKPELYSIVLAEEADFFPDSSSPLVIKQAFHIVFGNSDVKVSIAEDMGAYVLVDDFWAYQREVAENLEKKLDKTGDSSETTVTFSQASKRENISAGEKLSVLFGKISKWLSDLKTVAFTGKYEDLSGTPEIPTVGNGTITIKQAGTVKGSFTTNQAGNKEIELTDNNTTYSAATQSANGLMSAADKKKLDGVAASANNYSLPLAAAGTRGGAKIGYSQNGKNYPVQLSSEKMYVNVPWTDTNTWRGIQDNLTSTDTDKSLSAKQGKVLNDKFTNYLPLNGGTINGTLKIRNTSYPNAGIDLRVDSEGANITMHTKIANKHYEIDTCDDRLRIYQSVNGAITTPAEVDADSKLNINGRAETAVSMTPRTIVTFTMSSSVITTDVNWLNSYLSVGPVYLMVVDTKTQYGKTYYTLKFTAFNSPYFEVNLLCGVNVVKMSYIGTGYRFEKLSSGPTTSEYQVRFYKLLEI